MTFSAPFHLAAAMLVLATGAGLAGEDEFLDRFQGSWSGTGEIRRDQSGPHGISCSVAGQPAPDRLVVNGNCRAAIIFSRTIGADLSFDPRTGLYSGTYVGARVGPARLSGRRSGDAVRLTIEWPRPVNGDTKASMVISNDGRGGMRIVVADSLEPGGPVRETTDIAFVRN